MHNSLHAFVNHVSRLIDGGKTNQPLRLIHDFVERIITEPLCTAQVFGSKELDALCQRVGNSIFKAIKINNAGATAGDNRRSVYVYLVTKLQKSGGHSRVIEDFIKAWPEGRHIILSTELAGRSDAGYFLSGQAERLNVIFESAIRGNYEKRLTWLQKRLLEINPDKIYLFNHHQDSVAVAAIQPEMGLDATFYHHGDHHMCLGVYLSHCKHIDPNPMGFHNCRNALGINNIYVPLTVEDKGARPKDRSFLSDQRLITCTAARSNKIEIPYFISYLDIVPQILKTTGGLHIHIGRLSPWALYKIRRGLKRSGVQRDRFLYTPFVPSVWSALHNYHVDLYIASFPYGGALTLIEAMGAGVPVALHRHIFSRMLSGIDLAYPGAFSWRSPDELLDFCSKLTPEHLDKCSRSARSQYLKFHRLEILEDILNSRDQIDFTPGDLNHSYYVESDEWACWMEKQVSFERVIRRGIYRLFRATRERFF